MIEVGDLVLCTVERMENTMVFVRINADGKEVDGSIVVSEIAPGRIRNLRDYVVPKKKIVCKVLRISGNGNIELSLRRVSAKEKKEVLEKESQEKSYSSIVRGIVGGGAEAILKKISLEEDLPSFFGGAKEDPKKLEKFFGKAESEKILEVLNSQKQKKAVIKKEIILKSENSNGISHVKEILGEIGGIEIKYVSAGKYSLKAESEDVKKASNKLREALESIEKKAKKMGFEFSIKER